MYIAVACKRSHLQHLWCGLNLAVSHKPEIVELKSSVEIDIRVIFAFCFDIYVKTFQSYPKTKILKCIILQSLLFVLFFLRFVSGNFEVLTKQMLVSNMFRYHI